jgi:hypothetical protein
VKSITPVGFTKHRISQRGITMPSYRIRRIVALTVAVLASASLTAVPAGAATHRAHHRAHHAKRHHQTNGIPQHNGGDQDGDNNGGPSDGDGNV